MKVSYAMQTFSQSVADAFETGITDLNCLLLQNSEVTVEFICVINKLFDALNSSNRLRKFSKAPLSLKNFREWQTFFEAAYHYINRLKMSSGKLLTEVSAGNFHLSVYSH